MTLIGREWVAHRAAQVARINICVLRRDGSVWCWGDNSYHQVSDR